VRLPCIMYLVIFVLKLIDAMDRQPLNHPMS
jgi:hypothetical protein